MPKLLNLGCGPRFSSDPAWTNIDFQSRDSHVIAHDLKRGIPFGDNTFDVVYHSHVLEHFFRKDALRFLRECRRVLKKGGVLRVVVPDLEGVVKTYLHALDLASQDDERWKQNYEYVMLELYDQAVRERPGGEMGDYLKHEQIPNLEFVLEQGGVDAQIIMDEARRAADHSNPGAGNQSVLGQLPRRVYRYLRRTGFGREALLRLILGQEYGVLQLGRFRRRGEPHLWMYDRYSLLKLLRDSGFSSPQLFGAAESQVTNWTDFDLDTEPDGAVYKPYSLYAEARK
jgi:predicted SAM-dependent methyltransferase